MGRLAGDEVLDLFARKRLELQQTLGKHDEGVVLVGDDPPGVGIGLIDQAADLLVDAVRTRRARLIAPAVWAPYFWFRGILNPILEWKLLRDNAVGDIIRDLEHSRAR